MKWVYALFNISHHHCFCDKKWDYDRCGYRIIVMACNKCGLEKVITYNLDEG